MLIVRLEMGEKRYMKASIIVTVYNCEKYIERCLQSIKRQSYKCIEVIIVDDGSEDLSAQFCETFAKENDNVKFIHKENGGTISARRMGLMLATGDVVCFIDGDDWIANEFCMQLIHPFLDDPSISMVSSGLCYEYIENPGKNFVLYDGVESGLYDKERIEERLLPNFIYDIDNDKSAITSSICCKMLKKGIALDAMKDMDERLTIGEDGAYVLAVLLKSEKVYVLHEALYFYEQHMGSQNYTFNVGSYQQLRLLQLCMEKIVLHARNEQAIKQQIAFYIKGYLICIQKDVFGIDDDGRIYSFPDDEIKWNSRIVICGAGRVGRQYVKYVKKSEKYQLAGWIDINNNNAWEKVDEPCEIGEIIKLEYDYIVVAFNDDRLLKQVKTDIMSRGVVEAKIICKKPISYRI